jgi:lipoprotein-anchoring transpeptidase ErfK/SrfK
MKMMRIRKAPILPRSFLHAAFAVAALALVIGAAPAKPAQAGSSSKTIEPATSYPRVGVLTSAKLVVRAQPRTSARSLRSLSQFRPDFFPTVLLAVSESRDADGHLWLKVSTPMRPNGRFGWVSAQFVESTPVHTQIVVDVSSRALYMYDHGKLRYRTRIAVGTQANPTPLGHFYVQRRFKPTNSFLGSFAFETSAYAPRLSEWPGGGLIGIHGTSQPQLLGKAVSHGCIRMSNSAARVLQRLVAIGTPVVIRR